MNLQMKVLLDNLVPGKTADEVINKIFELDIIRNVALSRGLKYYVGLSRNFSKMEKLGLIKEMPKKKSDTRKEKIWKSVAAAVKKFNASL